MTGEMLPPNLNEADTLLSDLFQDVQSWEGYLDDERQDLLQGDGTLSDNGKLKTGAKAVASLFESKVRFGDPYDNLLPLTEETFKESGTELTEFYRQQIQKQFDFYYMTLAVSLIPKPSAQFWRLTCQLDFNATEDSSRIIQTIFPNHQWRSVVNFGVGMDLGVNGNLEWSVGVNEAQLEVIRNLLPADLKANVSNKNDLKSSFALPNYRYELGHPEITASGEGDSICYWRIQDQELQKIGTARFVTVFKVPQGTKSIKLNGIAWAEPNISWLTADVHDVFQELSARFQGLLRQRNDVASQFARGDIKEWILKLPSA